MLEENSVWQTTVADGVTTQWTFSVPYVESKSVKLYISHDNVLTEIDDSLYIFDHTTNKLTYPIDGSFPVPAGDIVLIWRQTSIVQEEDSSHVAFKSNDVERMADKLTAICQELSDKLKRTITFNPTASDIMTDADSFEQMLKEYADDKIADHNTSQDAHQDIRTAITTAVSEHNSSSTSHSDIRTLAENAMPKSGGTFSGDITFQSTKKINFQNSQISENNAGNIRIGDGNGNGLIVSKNGSGAALFYNNGTQYADIIKSTDVKTTYDSTSANPMSGIAVDSAVASEKAERQSSDNNLQSQIDALTSASDVVDVVADYTALSQYDTSKLTDNDLIKVLVDSTHDNATTYYRWSISSSSFSYVGAEGSYYTKSESDAKYLTKTDAASTYATQSSLTTALATKQDTLTAGTGISISSNTISTDAIRNNATGSNSVGILGNASSADNTVTVGVNASTSATGAIALGKDASASANNAIQIGAGTNSDANTLQILNYQLLDAAGKVPLGRLPNATVSLDRNWYTGNIGKTITVADTTGCQSVHVFKNGVLLQPTQDYTISGTTLTLVSDLVESDKIILERCNLLSGDNLVRSNDVFNIVKCTQEEYDALVSAGTVSQTTLYGIIPSAS